MAFTAMETTPTWLEVAHRAGSRFVFIVLPGTSACRFYGIACTHARPHAHAHTPTPHTRTPTRHLYSLALACLSFLATCADVPSPACPSSLQLVLLRLTSCLRGSGHFLLLQQLGLNWSPSLIYNRRAFIPNK